MSTRGWDIEREPKTISTEVPAEWADDLDGICKQFGLELDRVLQMMIYRVIVYSDRLPQAMQEYEEAAGESTESVSDSTG